MHLAGSGKATQLSRIAGFSPPSVGAPRWAEARLPDLGLHVLRCARYVMGGRANRQIAAARLPALLTSTPCQLKGKLVVQPSRSQEDAMVQFQQVVGLSMARKLENGHL